MERKLKIVCAWCDKELSEKEGFEGTTPGICDNCLNQHFPHLADIIRWGLEVEKIEEIY